MRRTKRLKTPVVIILGPPGSGKGTQAGLLADYLDIVHLETSAVIERKFRNAKKGEKVKIEGKVYSLEKEKKMRDAGELMSPPLITFWVKEEIKRLYREEKGIVFSGSPRTLYEAEKIVPFLEKFYEKKSIKVIFLKLSAKDSIWRNSHRRSCELMRHPIIYNKETKNLKHCPLDGSKLVRRKDDKPEIIKFRLKEYEERTKPVINYLRKHRFKIFEINGAPPPDKIHKNILKVLSL